MPHGHANWHDLNTTAVEDAAEFYEGVFGWKVHRVEPTASGAYHILHNGRATFGGITSMAADHGLPPHWAAYLEVDDLDAALARVAEAGGTVAFGPIPIEDVGRFAAIVDPLGASAYLIQTLKPEAVPAAAPGNFCWLSLTSPDPGATQAFWSAVLGWTFREQPMEGGPAITLAFAGETSVADLEAAEGPAAILPHVQVAALEDTLVAAEGRGARTVSAPMDLGPFGRVAVFADPQGAALAIYEAPSP